MILRGFSARREPRKIFSRVFPHGRERERRRYPARPRPFGAAAAAIARDFGAAKPERVRAGRVRCRLMGKDQALREGRSAGQAPGAGRDVVEGEGHRDAGVKVHQADHVGDADMVERLRFGDGAPAAFTARAAAPTPSSNVSASRSNSFAVRNRASQMTGLPAPSANPRYQAASSRKRRGSFGLPSLMPIVVTAPSPRQPICSS
jgi:hypothetical protein